MGDAVAASLGGNLSRPSRQLEPIAGDLRRAARALGRSPLFAVVTALLIALGVGTCTTIFTLVDRVLLRPLPLPEPRSLVRLYEASPARQVVRTGVARGNLAEWRTRTRSFAGLALSYTMGRTLSDGGEADVIAVAQVTCDFFPVLGVAPVLGTGFTPEQCRAATFSSAAAPISTDPVILLGEGLWRRRFGADPGVVGRIVFLDRRPFRVIGVTPEEVRAAAPGAAAFIAWELDQSLPYDQRYTSAIGRMRPGIGAGAAQADLAAIATALGSERPLTNRDWTVGLVPLQEDTVGGFRPVLLTLLAAAGLLLLVACANVATLFSARALGRSHESAVRLALGAPRVRILRQGLFESGIVALSGGALGTMGAVLAVRYVRLAWVDLPRAHELATDGAVLAFALVATLGSATLAGLLPALRHARGDPNDAILAGRRLSAGRRENRGRNALVAIEVALTVVLLAGAGLLVRSVGGLRASDPGFDPRDVVVAPVLLDAEKYRTGGASRAYYERLFARLTALPGVLAVGGATTLPTSEVGPDFARPVWPLAAAGDERVRREAAVRIVTPGYVEALRLRIVAGRPFDASDGPDSRRVVAVSEALARTAWPGRSPIGEQLVVDYSTAGTSAYEVVGVIGDVRFGGPRSEPLEEVYFPHAQRSYLILNVALRTAPGVLLPLESVRQALRDVDPLLPPHGVYRLDELLGATYLREQRAMHLLLVFAVAAALLSALGIYGTVAYRVRQQTREIGVRMALGASPGRVVGWVAAEIGRLLAVGCFAGLAAAAIGTRFLTSLLYGVAPHDPRTALGVLALLALIGAMAAGLPAYQAARVDPVTALRRE